MHAWVLPSFVYIFPVVGVNMHRQFSGKTPRSNEWNLQKKKGQLTWQWNGKNALPWIWNTSSNGPCDNCYVRVLYLIRTFDTFCLFIINLSSIYLRLLKEVFRFSPIFLLKLFSKKNNQPLWSFFAKKKLLSESQVSRCSFDPKGLASFLISSEYHLNLRYFTRFHEICTMRITG